MCRSFFNIQEYYGFIITFSIIVFSSYLLYIIKNKYGNVQSAINKTLMVLNKYAVPILFIYIILMLIWSYCYLFINPFRLTINPGGDSAFHTQIYYNLSHGNGPETSIFFKSGDFIHDNPYYYASIFSMGPYFISILILPLLYLLYPYPPMHIYVIVIVVFTIGAPGMYLAVRQLKGSKALSLIGAIGYCILPQMEHTIFHFGYPEEISYAFIPYLFAALFARKWKWFYLSVFIIAFIGYPYTYVTIIIGIAAAMFFRAPIAGGITVLIGALANIYTSAVIKQSICGIASNPDMSIFKEKAVNFVTQPDSYYKVGFLDQTVYIYLILITVAFLPLYALRGKWKNQAIGLFLISFGDAFVNSFRLTGWYSHRTAGWVIPLYLAAFMVCTSDHEQANTEKPQFYKIARMVIFAGIVSMTLWTTLRYPWVGLNSFLRVDLDYYKLHDPYNESKNIREVLTQLPATERARAILNKINEIVADNASIAYLENIGIGNYLANRKNAWQIDDGFPDSVEYFIISGINSSVRVNAGVKKRLLALIEKDKSELIYYDDPYLLIFKNKDPKPPPRLESVLQWDVMLHPWRSCNK
ncbi:MAG: hypothetical protein L7F77_00835 [Candidatus Magnetominusculus sp. LBB02]|nr:hypothetical protein [Candidatus Magnetominusculus sp. LBB02]